MGQAAVLTLRPALPADAPRLADLFRASVEILGAEDYSAQQIDAWAGVADDEAGFAAKLSAGLTIVAVQSGVIVGFASLKGADVVDMLYVDPDHARQGVGAALCEALERLAGARGAKKISADASDAAEAFFARRGYQGQQRNMVFLGDEVLGNTTMTKTLAPAQSGPVQ